MSVKNTKIALAAPTLCGWPRKYRIIHASLAFPKEAPPKSTPLGNAPPKSKPFRKMLLPNEAHKLKIIS